MNSFLDISWWDFKLGNFCLNKTCWLCLIMYGALLRLDRLRPFFNLDRSDIVTHYLLSLDHLFQRGDIFLVTNASI